MIVLAPTFDRTLRYERIIPVTNNFCQGFCGKKWRKINHEISTDNKNFEPYCSDCVKFLATNKLLTRAKEDSKHLSTEILLPESGNLSKDRNTDQADANSVTSDTLSEYHGSSINYDEPQINQEPAELELDETSKRFLQLLEATQKPLTTVQIQAQLNLSESYVFLLLHRFREDISTCLDPQGRKNRKLYAFKQNPSSLAELQEQEKFFETKILQCLEINSPLNLKQICKWLKNEAKTNYNGKVFVSKLLNDLVNSGAIADKIIYQRKSPGHYYTLATKQHLLELN